MKDLSIGTGTAGLLRRYRSWTTFVGAAALGIFILSGTAQAQQQPCARGELVDALLNDEAKRIGSAVETLKEKGEVSRYIEVINEEPPTAGPAERLMILVHPELKVARVFLVHDGMVCERYLIGPQLHEKAWMAARGIRV